MLGTHSHGALAGPPEGVGRSRSDGLLRARLQEQFLILDGEAEGALLDEEALVLPGVRMQGAAHARIETRLDLKQLSTGFVRSLAKGKLLAEAGFQRLTAL